MPTDPAPEAQPTDRPEDPHRVYAAASALGGRLRPPPWLRRAVAVILVALVGGILGLLVAGSVQHHVGPFDATLSLSPALGGDTVVRLPPLGTLTIDSHDGPLQLMVEIQQLRPDEARRLIANPSQFAGIGDRVADDVRSAIVDLAVRSAVAVLLGATLLCALVFRGLARGLSGLLVAVLALTASGGIAVATVRPNALAEPRFTGLLTSAPNLIGSAEDLVEHFDRYRQQLAHLVTNLSQLYAVTSTLPVFSPLDGTVRVLHVSDLHLNPAGISLIRSLVEQFQIDAVFDTGDITDFGSVPETYFVDLIGSLDVPYVYIRGNHDSLATQRAVAAEPNTIVLDDEVTTVAGLRIYGDGDPRFTPDKTTRDPGSKRGDVLDTFAEHLGEAVRESQPPRLDAVLIHDPAVADALFGKVPLVLAGHLHHRKVVREDGTLLLVEGSTGGAGLRGLEGEEPTPLTATVLYFDRDTGDLEAYDTVTVGGLGRQEAQIERHIVQSPEEATDSEAGLPVGRGHG